MLNNINILFKSNTRIRYVHKIKKNFKIKNAYFYCIVLDLNFIYAIANIGNFLVEGNCILQQQVQS